MQINEKELQKKYRKELEDYRKEKKEFDFSGDISFENVSYTYSKKSPFEFKALDQTSFLIKRDKITCVIGNTGSGKSTLIQLTNGLLVSETGRTLVGDYPIPASIGKIKEVKQLRKEIGLVFQFPEYQLFQDTVEKDISFGPINLGLNKEEAIQNVPNLLKIVSLPTDYKDRSPFDLSGGQKRRVAIAGIIAMNGNTLVLDEPTGGLDPKGENDFMNLFESLNKEHKKRIIMVTHNMDQVLRIADDVIVLNKGKMMAIGSPSEIFSNQKLLDEIGIEPPKIFQLMYKLKEKGINLLNQDIRNIEDFALAVKTYKTKNAKKEMEGDIK